jgi:hypothetical protein
MSVTPLTGQNGQNEDTNDALYSPTNKANVMLYCNPMDATTVADSPVVGTGLDVKFNSAQPAPESKNPKVTETVVQQSNMGTKRISVLQGPFSVGDEALHKSKRTMDQQRTPSKTSGAATIMALSPHVRNVADGFKQ